MLKSFLTYFWGNQNTDLSLEDAYSVLNDAKTGQVDDDFVQEKVAEVDSDYSCSHKTGVVTRVELDKYIIDDIYEYKEKELTLAVGVKVSYVVYSCDSRVRISNVHIVDNEWNTIEGEEKSKWCNRCLISKVIKRDGRNIVVSPGDISIDLNSVTTEFIPMKGDWVELDVKCVVDEGVTNLFGQILEVNKICPLRPKIVNGVIKSWNPIEQSGVIDQNVYVTREALYMGYIPVVGDKIVAEVIESEQGRCIWRALKIMPFKIAKTFETLNFLPDDFVTDHEEVHISEDVFIYEGTINSDKQFEFTVTNISSFDLTLINIKFQNLDPQCKIVNSDIFPKLLKSKEVVTVQGLCHIKTAGQSKELLIFVFKDFKIARWVNVATKSESQNNVRRYNANKLHSKSSLSNGNLFNNKDIILGEKPHTAPRFIPYHLPEYPIPQKLWDLFSKYDNNFRERHLLLEDLMFVKPVLNKPLAFQCYEDKFHTLLHLEEISNIIAVRVYDRDQVCFIRNGEYLMLEIENLSEQRPSIISGDTFIACDSYQASSHKLQGWVHKVGAKHVYLKFTPIFHDTYDGEDYSVKVVQSRTQIRKMHQAIGLAARSLGREFLFPSKVMNREYQVNFTYDKYDDIIPDNQSTVSDDKLNNSNSNFKKPSKLTNAEVLNIIRVRRSLEKTENNSAHVESQLLLDNEVKASGNKKLVNNESVHVINKLKLEWFDKTLNYYQKEAVRNILLGEARPLPYLIFGPPGTGKTVTLVEAILQLLRLIPSSRLLVATPSNSAADLIATRLIDTCVLKPGDLVRFVAYRYVAEDSIPEKLAPYCATGNIAKEGTSSLPTVVTGNGLVLGCESSVLGRHRVTVGTCTAIGQLFSMSFPKGHFTHIIIDEAAQATEPEIMIPLSFLDISLGQVILAGDPMQLGPVVTSKFASELGLEGTFMERLLNRFPYIRDVEGFQKTGGYDPRLVTRLVYNYRSLPEILELPNSLFYYAELLPTISSVNSAEATLLETIKEILPIRNKGSTPSFVFHGVNGQDYQTFDSPSWFNPDEASQVFFYLNELYRLGLNSNDIGIVSPYIKQVKQIRSLLFEAEFDAPKIGTVEEFQGQEFNVILLSTVRSCVNMVESDKKFNLGFVANPRRLNVALTRAKVLVIIIGNPHLLMTDPLWRSVVIHSVKNESYCGCDLPLSL